MLLDAEVGWLALGVLGVLTAGSVAGWLLSRRPMDARRQATVDNLVARVNAWWVMVAVIVGALALGRGAVILLFALVSFLALRELLTLIPSRRADHSALFWAFFLGVPLQYGLLWFEWYGMFAIALPVYLFLFLSVRVAVSGDTERYMHRIGTLNFGLMVGVYCISHAPALLMLRIEGYEGEQYKLLVFLIAIVQLSDVLQYVWGKLLGRRLLAPRVSPAKTVEGFVGGVATATAIGAALTPLTPFTPGVATLFALGIALAGVAGGLVTSAIKRGAGVKDYGDLLPGHGGIMDRVDSLAFAAPLFFHLVRYFYSSV